MRWFFVSFPFILFIAACATKDPNFGFVRTVTFSSFQTFDYENTLISGMDIEVSEVMMLEKLSETTLTAAFQDNGFVENEADHDFSVVAKWRKAVSSYPDIFDSIDGPRESIDRRVDPSFRFASRYHLIVEVFETSSDDVFWRKELPNIFDATQLTEERIIDSLNRAVEKFPNRVEKDPNLLDFH